MVVRTTASITKPRAPPWSNTKTGNCVRTKPSAPLDHQCALYPRSAHCARRSACRFDSQDPLPSETRYAVCQSRLSGGRQYALRRGYFASSVEELQYACAPRCRLRQAEGQSPKAATGQVTFLRDPMCRTKTTLPCEGTTGIDAGRGSVERIRWCEYRAGWGVLLSPLAQCPTAKSRPAIG